MQRGGFTQRRNDRNDFADGGKRDTGVKFEAVCGGFFIRQATTRRSG
jgi:hypothetical protein